MRRKVIRVKTREKTYFQDRIRSEIFIVVRSNHRQFTPKALGVWRVKAIKVQPIMTDNNGPQTITHSYQSCQGCQHLHSQGLVFGHNFVEKRYSCMHPVAVQEEKGFAGPLGFGPGKTIEARTRSHEVRTPHWCPFLNNEKAKG